LNLDDGVSSDRDGGETIECDRYQASSIPSVGEGEISTIQITAVYRAITIGNPDDDIIHPLNGGEILCVTGIRQV
jgi:hypothetical protein